jgi:hypothetical protein
MQTKRIAWKRNSALNGGRVTIDAYIDGKRVGQISNFTEDDGTRGWAVWCGDSAPTGWSEGTQPTVTKAKRMLQRLVT